MALTLIEVIILLGTCFILAALILPAFVKAKAGSHVNCMSNLKQVGLGWIGWSYDHDSNEFPFRTPVPKSGTFGITDPLRNNAWWQFTFISNEIDTPKVLVCPADKNVGAPRTIADKWSATDTNGGFMTAGFRHLATSYTIGLEATHPRGGNEVEGGSRILGTDRNILFDSGDGACSSGLAGNGVIRVKGRNGQNAPAAASWTNAIHGGLGNVLCADGSVEARTTKELNALCDLSDDNGNIHFLVPR